MFRLWSRGMARVKGRMVAPFINAGGGQQAQSAGSSARKPTAREQRQERPCDHSRRSPSSPHLMKTLERSTSQDSTRHSSSLSILKQTIPVLVTLLCWTLATGAGAQPEAKPNSATKTAPAAQPCATPSGGAGCTPCEMSLGKFRQIVEPIINKPGRFGSFLSHCQDGKQTCR